MQIRRNDFGDSVSDHFRRTVLGVPVDICLDVFSSAKLLHAHGGGQIITLNAEMTMAARSNNALEMAIKAADLVIPDGAGVVWALSRQGVRVVRTPGIELAWSLLTHAASQGWTVALVGGSPEVMESLKLRLNLELPLLRLAMAIDGYRPVDEWSDVESRLKSLAPDLVLVALGIPRQETWAQSMRLSGSTGLWMGVGGSFDVWAGSKKRAPAWMRDLHIEWLYRLVQEPSRWKRMLSLPAFAWDVLTTGERSNR